MGKKGWWWEPNYSLLLWVLFSPLSLSHVGGIKKSCLRQHCASHIVFVAFSLSFPSWENGRRRNFSIRSFGWESQSFFSFGTPLVQEREKGRFTSCLRKEIYLFWWENKEVFWIFWGENLFVGDLNARKASTRDKKAFLPLFMFQERHTNSTCFPTGTAIFG